MSKILKSTEQLLILFLTLVMFTICVNAQDAVTAGNFRIGEKLTYSVSINKLSDVAYAEMNVVSAGRIGDVDAVELRSRFRTIDFAIGAFYYIDESRTTFASPVTGLPLYSRKTDRTAGLPKEYISDHRNVPATEHDLNTLLYALRNGGIGGTLQFQENGRSYSAVFQHGKTESVTVDAGNFETTIVALQSDYLTEIGISEMTVNLSTDAARLPVLVRFKTGKGIFRMSLLVASIAESNGGGQPTPTTTPLPTPRPSATPKPVTTPTPYIPNQPISSELAFVLGENLEYRITDNGREIGTLLLRAESRGMVDGKDSLKLSARIVNIIDPTSILGTGGEIIAFVDPDSLSPRRIEIKLSGGLASINQTAIFDELTNAISFGNANRIDAPVGTHNILSLLFALRSFNLKPSTDSTNPVNDTRVAVFWDNKTSVFTLRPTDAETVEILGEKLSGQPISISTGNPQFDTLSPKIWLGNDERRLPLRLAIGGYRIDLVSHSIITPK